MPRVNERYFDSFADLERLSVTAEQLRQDVLDLKMEARGVSRFT